MIQLTNEEIEILWNYYHNAALKLDERYTTLHDSDIVDEDVKKLQLNTWLIEISRINHRLDELEDEKN